MTLGKPIASLAIAAAVGVVNFLLLVYCWALIAAYSPLPHWLIDLGLRGNAFRSVLFPVDFVTSVILCVPAGLILLRLRPCSVWAYIAIAVLPGFIWRNVSLLGNPDFPRFWLPFTLGLTPELLALPAAVLLVRFLSNRGAPNKSFKSKPLRGST